LVMVKSFPVATVVSPPSVTAPVEVENVPFEDEASKLPLVWENPVMFSSAPPLVSLVVPAVCSAPFARFTVVLFIVAVPVAAPIFKVVAAPKALIVVAVVFKRSNDVDPATREVVIVGLVPNTATPVPVSSERVSLSAVEVPLVVNCPPVVVNSARSAVKEEKVTVEDALSVVVDTPVAPVMAPVPVMAIDGEERKLVKPVPKVIPLKVLFVWAVTFPKFTPVMVFAPVVFAVPVRLIPSALTDVVPLAAESVALKVAAVPVVLLYVWVNIPVPLARVKFFPLATVVSPPKVTAPVEVENVPFEDDASKLPLVWV
jgi:hypothetical protein